MKLLDYVAILFLIFQGNSIMFPIVAASSYNLKANMHNVSLFSTLSPTFVISYLFDDRCSNRCEVISLCGFVVHFPDD